MYFGADHFQTTILNYQKMLWCKRIVSKLPPLFFLFPSKKSQNCVAQKPETLHLLSFYEWPPLRSASCK